MEWKKTATRNNKQWPNVFHTSTCKSAVYLSGPEVNEEEEDECNRFTPQEVKEAIFREQSLLTLPVNRYNSSSDVRRSGSVCIKLDPVSRIQTRKRNKKVTVKNIFDLIMILIYLYTIFGTSKRISKLQRENLALLSTTRYIPSWIWIWILTGFRIQIRWTN
jgi:hypothetical protein